MAWSTRLVYGNNMFPEGLDLPVSTYALRGGALFFFVTPLIGLITL
jgi:hypothetical protein